LLAFGLEESIKNTDLFTKYWKITLSESIPQKDIIKKINRKGGTEIPAKLHKTAFLAHLGL